MKNYVKKETDKDGITWYFDKLNRLHRTDGPAIEGATGSKEWWIQGKTHRIDGPYFIASNGRGVLWRVNGLAITKIEIKKLQNLRKTFNDDDLLNFLLLEGIIVL